MPPFKHGLLIQGSTDSQWGPASGQIQRYIHTSRCCHKIPNPTEHDHVSPDKACKRWGQMRRISHFVDISDIAMGNHYVMYTKCSQISLHIVSHQHDFWNGKLLLLKSHKLLLSLPPGMIYTYGEVLLSEIYNYRGMSVPCVEYNRSRHPLW